MKRANHPTAACAALPAALLAILLTAACGDKEEQTPPPPPPAPAAPAPEDLYRTAKESLDAAQDDEARDKATALLTQAAEAGSTEAMYALVELLNETDPARALEYLEKASAAGHPRACLLQGMRCFRAGDKEAAARFFEKAAEQNSPDAAYNLGLMLLAGQGAEKDETRGFELLRRAAEAGQKEARLQLASCYRAGRGTAADTARAEALYTELAEEGNTEAMVALGKMLSGDAALSWKIKAARSGHVPSMVEAADLCLARADYAAAQPLLQEAARRNDAAACAKLGLLALHGLGMDKDETLGFRCLQQAAQAGDPEAQYNLGVCLEEGKGTQPNLKTAREWYTRAAEQSLPAACGALARCCAEGIGGPQDAAAALTWLRKGADAGDPACLFAYGCSLAEGRGTSKDAEQGRSLIRRAADAGWQPAREYPAADTPHPPAS